VTETADSLPIVVDAFRGPFTGPHPKWALRGWLLICGIWSVAALVASDTELSVLWGVAISVLALCLFTYLTARGRMFLTPAFLGLVFGTGYSLSFGALVTRSEVLPSEGWGSVGRFAFTNQDMVSPMLVIVAGVLGIAGGTRIAESLWSSLRTRPILRRQDNPSMTSLASWALASGFVIAICAVLGIGRVGLSDSTLLPFKLAGILVVVRGYLLPALGGLLVQRAVTARGQGRLFQTLLLLTCVGAAATFSAVSRGLGGAYMVPAILYAIARQSSFRLPLRRFASALSLVVLVLVVGGSIVTMQRNTLYFGDGWMSLSELTSQTEGVSDFSEGAFSTFSGLLGGRLSGIDVFLALVSGPGVHPDPTIPLKVFVGDDDLSQSLVIETLGFAPAGSEGTGGLAFGIGFTLWGILALGGTILMPFLGTALLMIFVCSIEGLLTRFGEEGMGAVLGCLVALNAWGAPTWFYVSRQVAVVAVCLLIARRGSKAMEAPFFAGIGVARRA